MVCDFFFPQAGGIEIHIFQVAKHLIQLGHHVVVVTHAYGQRSGVRYLEEGLKVYYVPFFCVYRESSFPTVFSFLPIFRQIMLRERIQIVHGHGSMSTMCHEAIVHGRTMRLATVFTDHSLLQFDETSSILVNKLMKFTMTDVDHVICVSHTCRENTVLRCALDPAKTSVIPNALISENFKPRQESELSFADEEIITIVVCSRLYENKGADLLVRIIPKICSIDPKIRICIAGSGPKIVDLQQMCEQHSLQDRVQLFGEIRHDEVRDFMVRGQIYLHASLTEAFGTVIVEAASCGLLVVTTSVGGIPEVLPEHMTVYAEPAVQSLVDATLKAADMLRTKTVDPRSFHDEIKQMYNWKDVAERTRLVYDQVLAHGMAQESQVERWQRHYQCGLLAGKLFVLCVVVDTILLWIIEILYPVTEIDGVVDWSQTAPKCYTDNEINV